MKHRGGGNVGVSSSPGGKDMVLPLTQADLNGNTTLSATVRVRRVRKKKSTRSGGGGMWGFGTLLSFILAAGLLTAFVQRHVILENYGTSSTISKKGNNGDNGDDDNDNGDALLRETVERFVQEESKTAENLPLKDFPSLQYALHHSDIVLLYFAAAWCPMSTPITKLVDEIFSPLLLPPPPSEADRDRDLEQHQLQLEEEDTRRHGQLSLVYISSDTTAEEMNNYQKPNWMVVPFENTRERADIKRHFKTCAKREMEELHMMANTRQHEIPTLIVLSGATQQVLTFHGIKDIQQANAAEMMMTESTSKETAAADTAKSLVDSWMELKRLSNSLAEKFEIE